MTAPVARGDRARWTVEGTVTGVIADRIVFLLDQSGRRHTIGLDPFDSLPMGVTLERIDDEGAGS